MNNQDLVNHDIIKNLVDKHFGLDTNSFKYFSDKIDNRNIDEIYQNILGDSKDLRIRFKVDPNVLEKFDEGWKLFKNYFNLFCYLTGIKYSDFRMNRIAIDGNSVKLEKALKNFYAHDDERLNRFLLDNHRFGNEIYEEEKVETLVSDIKRYMNEIGVYKLPLKENLELVLSLNFADWFLCSTGQSWSSCLNLDSDYTCCYWTGLPGLIGDKNRAMLYLTDGTSKEYQGIKTDSFTNRVWTLLDSANNIHVSRSYPKTYIKTETISEITGINLKDIEVDYFSKYPVDFLYHENEFSSSIYLDYMGLSSSGNYCYKSAGGYWSFYKETKELTRESPFNYSRGLSGLIALNSKITDIRTLKCQDCGNQINEGDEIAYYDGDVIVCQRCSDRHGRTCYHCGSNGLADHQIWFMTIEGVICEYCKDEYYVYCPTCEELTLRENIIKAGEENGEDICEDCIKNDLDFYICPDCNKYFPIDNYGFIDENYGDKTCKKCLIKYTEKNQLKFNFSDTTEYYEMEQSVAVTKVNVEYIA